MQNFGDCGFFQWADSEVNTKSRRHGCESKGCFSIQSRATSANNDFCKKDMNSNMNLESTLMWSAKSSLYLRRINVPLDLVMQEAGSLDSMMVKALQVSQPMAQSQCLFPKAIWRQIYVGDKTITEAAIYQFLGHYVHGWLCRLPSSPFQCPQDPPTVPTLWCILPSLNAFAGSEDMDMSDTEGSFLLSSSVPDAETEPSGLGYHLGMMQDNNILVLKSILKTFGQGLFDIFEAMDPVDPEQMLKVAEPTLIAFQKLSFECGPFVEGVKEYIRNVSILDSIDDLMQKGYSSQELIDRYKSEKVQFEDVSRLHTEAEEAHRAANDHLQSLLEKFSYVKDIPIELEKQLAACEAETFLLKAHVDEVYEDMFALKLSMETAYHEMVKAVELECQTESVGDAAMLALENAKNWLKKQ